MIAMPFIVVGIVLAILSFILFCVTSAALLAKCPRAGFYLPAQVRERRGLAFVAHALVLAAILFLALQVTGRLWYVNLFSAWVGDALFCVVLVNSAVLLYQFLEKRYLLDKPKLRRRLLLGALSVVVTLVSGVAVIVALTVAFVIR